MHGVNPLQLVYLSNMGGSRRHQVGDPVFPFLVREGVELGRGGRLEVTARRPAT